LDNLDATIVRAASKIEHISEALDESKTKTIQDWVSTVQYKDHHDELSTSRIPNSGAWLLNHKTYCDWRRASYSSFLWLNGIGKPSQETTQLQVRSSTLLNSLLVGAGKSTLVSIIIDDVSSSIITTVNAERLSYFYCNKASRSTELENVSTILRSIVRQLSRFGNGPIMDLVIKEYKEKSGAGHLNRRECVDIIQKLTSLYPMTTIIIDGLDEAPKDTRTELLADIR
jgi:hypothetical protein